MISQRKMSFFSTLCCFSLASSLVVAMPKDASVEAGSASISRDGKTMRVEASDRAVINYSDFSVGKHEKVHFVQPSKDAVVLNRVTGKHGSEILGQIESNGQVFLVNPNGVYFGPNAEVNVGSLFASTLDIATQDFYVGNFEFSLGVGEGSIVNHGRINASDGGVVAFISPMTSNEGSITANGGSVYFAAGEKVRVDFGGDGLVSFAIDGALAKATVHQAGSIVAHTVNMEMTAVDNVLKDVVNMKGIAEGTKLVRHNGEIIITDQSHIVADKVSVSGRDGALVTLDGKMSLSKERSQFKVSGDSLSLKKLNIVSEEGSGEILLSSSGEKGFIRIEDGAQILAPKNFALIMSTADGQSIYMGDQAEVATVGRDMSFHSPIILQGNHAKIHTSGKDGNIHFSEAVMGGEKASHLTIDAGQGSVAFDKSIGQKSPLGQLEVNAGNLTLPSLVVTKGHDVVISSPTRFNQDVKIDTTGQGRFAGGNLSFKGANSSIDGNYKFIADVGSGKTYFEGPVGDRSSLQRFHIKAGHSTLAGNVKAVGGTIIYDSPVTINGTITMTDTGPTGIAFLSTVNGTSANTDSLTLNALMGRVLFAGVVGGTTPLTNLTVSSNTIEQLAAVTLADDAANALSYTAPAGITIAGDITISATGTTTVTMNNPITVSEAVTITSTPSTTGTVTISGANGPGSLTLSGATTNTFQNAPVTDLAFLSVTAQNNASSAISFNSGSDVDIIGDITLACAGSNAVDVTLACNTFNTQGGDITMSSNIATITATSLNSVNTNGGDFVASVADDTLSFASSFNLGGGDFTMTSSGGAGSTTTLSGNLNTGGGNATIGGSSNENVVLSGDSIYTYGGDLTMQASTLTTNSANINLGGGNMTVTGPYRHNTSATILTGNGNATFSGAITINNCDFNIDVGNAGNLQFVSTINSVTAASSSLYITGGTVSTVTFEADVGGGTTLQNIHVSAGTIAQALFADMAFNNGTFTYTADAINMGGNVTAGTTAGDITFTGPVYLQNSVTVTQNSGSGTAYEGDVVFNSSIDSFSGEMDLTVNAGTNIARFVGDVGEQVLLTTLDVTAGEMQVGASINTSGTQTYTGPTRLVGDSYFYSGGDITFTGSTSTINGYYSLSLEADGAVTLGGVVGGTLPLRLFNVSGSSIGVSGNVTTHP